MSSKVGSPFLLIVVTILFTAGLVYATIGLPNLINSWLIQTFDFPGVDSSIESSVTEAFIQSNHIRLIGFGCFAGVVALIGIGLVAEKRHLASLGAFAFFLPTFGHFALNMFFLAGLGILRVVWMPILDVSYSWLNLGDIAYLPYMVLVYPFHLAGADIRQFLAGAFASAGLLIFVLGVLAWFYARVQKVGTADFWIYRFSRHPQYLGWILWSYALMLRVSLRHDAFLQESNPGASLPWVISSLFIVCIALSEEVRMRREQGEAYERYRRRAPFLVPLPRTLSRLFSAPLRLILGKAWPETTWDLVWTFAIYLAVIALLSLPFVLLDWPPGGGWMSWPGCMT